MTRRVHAAPNRIIQLLGHQREIASAHYSEARVSGRQLRRDPCTCTNAVFSASIASLEFRSSTREFEILRLRTRILNGELAVSATFALSEG